MSAALLAFCLALQLAGAGQLAPSIAAAEDSAAAAARRSGAGAQRLISALGQAWRWRELRRGAAEPDFAMVAAGPQNQLLVADSVGLWVHDGLHWKPLGPWSSGAATLSTMVQRTEGGYVAVRDQQLIAIRDEAPETPIALSPSDLSGPTSQPIRLADGRLITANAQQIFLIGAQSLQPYLPTPANTQMIRALGCDSQGGLWCVTDGGIFRHRAEGWTAVPVTRGLRSRAVDIVKILAIGDRLVLLPRVFATRQSGLLWDGSQLTPLPDAGAQGQLSAALLTPAGDILVAIQYSGLKSLCWDDDEQCSWHPVHIPAPFDASVRSMTLMDDGRLALVTQQGKLLFNDSRSQRWMAHDPRSVGVSAVVNCLARARAGGVWIGTHEGVARFDGTHFAEVFLKAGDLGLPLEQITAIHEDRKGQLWLGSGSAFQGLLRFDGERWHRDELEIVKGYGVHAMAADPQGDLWLTMIALPGTTADFKSGAVLHRSQGRWIVHDHLGERLMPRVYSLAWQQDGTLLVGGLGGISRFDGQQWTEWLPSPLPRHRRAFAMIVRRNGDLWVGRGLNESGVSWLPARTLSWHRPERPGQNPPGPNERLLQRAAAASFAETADGRLWFASETGLYQVVRGQCHQISSQGAAREHSFWPVLTSSDGSSVWIGSLGGGLLRYASDDLAPPTATLPRVTVPDPDHARNVLLSWSGNDTWSTTPPERLLFSQSLDGAPYSAWTADSTRPFFDAEPGEHELALRAMDTAGNAQDEPTTLKFTVLPGPPPLWARPEMQLAYSTALLALCGLALVTLRRQRERRQDAQARNALNERLRELTRRLMTTQEDERRSLARDLHDDLGQLLTVTTMQIELAGEVDDAPGRASALELAAQSTRRAIDSVRNLAAQIRPTLLDDLGLETAVNATLDDFARATGMVLERDVLFEHDAVPDSVASHVFRIIKESLTNIVRHAHADRIALRLEVTAHAIEILVQDNGDGFDPQRSSSDHGIGLLGMRERAEALGGTFHIDSQAGRGTDLRVTIPLHETPQDGNLPTW